MKLAPIAMVFAVASAALADGRQRAVRSPQPIVLSSWTATQCSTTSGLPGFYFTRDEGQTVSGNDALPPINANVALMVSDVPNLLFAVLSNSLYESRDAGCHWYMRDRLSAEFEAIVAAPNGRGYAWSARHAQMLRISRTGSDLVSLPEPVFRIGVDPQDGQHLMAVSRLRIYESLNGGLSWSDNGSPPSRLLGAAFDPRDVRHIAVGYVNGASVSHDGGLSWQSSDTRQATVGNLVFAPADPNVIWMEGGVEGTSGGVYRSTNGGAAFDKLVSAASFGQDGLHASGSGGLFPHPASVDVVTVEASDALTFVDVRAGAPTLRKGRTPTWHHWDSVTWSPAPDVIYLTTLEYWAYNLSTEK